MAGVADGPGGPGADGTPQPAGRTAGSPTGCVSGGGALTDATIRPPHGGRLVDLLVTGDEAAELAGRARSWPGWQLTPRQRCDLELLACGGFSPLRTFLGKDDYAAVCDSMRLADGTLWPVPVTLDVPEEVAAAAQPGRRLALRDHDDTLLAVLRVQQSWRPALAAEAASVLGTTDP